MPTRHYHLTWMIRAVLITGLKCQTHHWQYIHHIHPNIIHPKDNWCSSSQQMFSQTFKHPLTDQIKYVWEMDIEPVSMHVWTDRYLQSMHMCAMNLDRVSTIILYVCIRVRALSVDWLPCSLYMWVWTDLRPALPAVAASALHWRTSSAGASTSHSLCVHAINIILYIYIIQNISHRMCSL